MFIIRDNSLYETDDYEQIQEAYEGYLYGSHRGFDIDEKVDTERNASIYRSRKNRRDAK